MQNTEQDIKDTKQNESTEPADSAATDAGQVEPAPFEPDEARPQKPEPEDEFADLAPHETRADPQADEQDDDSDDSDDQAEPLEPEEYETTLETVIEAVLFAADEPISPKRLVDIAEAGSIKRIRRCVHDLNKKYKQGGFSFRIEKIAGGYQMMTLPAFNPWLSKLIKVRTDSKLSAAALETLAVIAYKQPIIRADVEAVRGVASGEIIRNLMYKGLVKIVGRAEILGRPMLYGTTKKFLDAFGLNSLKDLPKVDELKNPEKGN